jgi:membrane-associated phospholipid phosphatase
VWRKVKRLRPSLALGLLASGLLPLVYAVAFGTQRGLMFDAQSIVPPQDPAHLRFKHLVWSLLRTIDVSSLALVGGALILFALARRRWDNALAVAILLLGANLTTKGLKLVLTRTDPFHANALRGDGVEGFPSGHATVAMSLALALVIAAPPALRALAALAGASYATAIGIGLILLGWHFPSDVAGGFLVAAAWAGFATVAAGRLTARFPQATRPSGSHVGQALAAALALGPSAAFAAILAVALYHRPGLLARGPANGHFFAAAAGLAALAIASVLAFTLAREHERT